jgi:ParB-like chromosome segregation protein Spo0J
LEIKKVDISSLKPHPKNPRVHPDSLIGKIQSSIKEFGWTSPILVSADGYILAGHARLKAAHKMGLRQVPVICLPLDGVKADAYMIADNKLQEGSSWDYERLAGLLQDLSDGAVNLKTTGFSEAEISSILHEINEIDIDDLNIAVNKPREPGGSKGLPEKTGLCCPRCGKEITGSLVV